MSFIEGCVSIVLLIPSHLALSATPLSADFYRKHEITRVELGEECIYQEEEEHHKVYRYVTNVQVRVWNQSGLTSDPSPPKRRGCSGEYSTTFCTFGKFRQHNLIG